MGETPIHPGHPNQTPNSDLDVLPSKLVRGDIDRHSKRIKAKTIPDIARGNSRVLQRSEHLPARRRRGSLAADGRRGRGRDRGRTTLFGRASHEARGALAAIGPGTEGFTRRVFERALGRARGDVARVRDREAQGAGGVDVDALAAWDDDVLVTLSVSRGRRGQG